MAKVSLIDIIDTGRGLEIVNPARRGVFAFLFLSIWLSFWTLGGIAAITQAFGSDTPIGGRLFLIVWLCGWAIGEVVAATIILWMLRGREVVTVTPDALVVRWEVFGIGPSQEFVLAGIVNMRASALPFGSTPGELLTLLQQGLGTIAFDYGAKTYRFGISMEEAEARLLIRRIEEKVPLAEAETG